MGFSKTPDEYLIDNFKGYTLVQEGEEHTARTGFFVCADFGDPSPYARCLEGYCLAINTEGVEQIEADIFYIAWVNTCKEKGRGVGTALLTRALEEAQARGFHTARMEVENPKAISIFQKIGKTGLITNVRYALSSLTDGKLVDVLPTKQFSSHPNLLSSTEAAGYLDAFPRNEDGMVYGSALHEIECVLDIQ